MNFKTGQIQIFITCLIIGVIGIFLLVLGIIVVIDARQISGIKLRQIKDGEYEAVLRDERYIVKYVSKADIVPLFGQALNESEIKFVLVRNDLPERVQNFVMHHEIYHLQDCRHEGFFSREIHANLGALPYAPIGFIQTVALTLINPERMAYYLKNLWSKQNIR